MAILNYVAGGGEGARERAPSMKNSEPVTKAALRSSAKKATALPMSSGLPAFLSGWYSLAILSAFSLNKSEKKHGLFLFCAMFCVFGAFYLSSVPRKCIRVWVVMAPGLTEFALTPLAASSRARILHSKRRAPLGGPPMPNWCPKSNKNILICKKMIDIYFSLAYKCKKL